MTDLLPEYSYVTHYGTPEGTATMTRTAEVLGPIPKRVTAPARDSDPHRSGQGRCAGRVSEVPLYELRLPPDRLLGVGIAPGTQAIRLSRLIDTADAHAGIQHDIQRLARPPLHRLRIPLHDHRGKRRIPIPADVAQFAAQQGDLA